MLNKETIIELLNSIHEHTMAKDIFVPTLKKIGLKGVKFTGGTDEVGIDIEYYELTQPEKHKSYVGIQFKKGNLVYSSGGAKNSVKEVKNQAEEAFEKEIHDIEGHATAFISRFIVAATGDINEKARSFIGKARQKGKDRRIDYWTGDRLAEYIQDHWMVEFEDYFSASLSKSDDIETDEEPIIDSDYIKDNYVELVTSCKKVLKTVDGTEAEILTTIAIMGGDGGVHLADLLMELGHTEDYYNEEFRHLTSLNYIEYDESLSLSGHANALQSLFYSIVEELIDAEEDPDSAEAIFESLIY